MMKKEIWMEKIESLAEAMYNRVVVDYNEFYIPYKGEDVSFLIFANKIFLRISSLNPIFEIDPSTSFYKIANEHNIKLASLSKFKEENIPVISLSNLELLLVAELFKPAGNIDDRIIFDFSKWLHFYKDYLYLPSELVKEYIDHQSIQFREYGNMLRTFKHLEKQLEEIEAEYKNDK